MDSEKEVRKGTSKETKKNTNVKKKTKFTNQEKTQLAIILVVIILAIVAIILFVNVKNTSGKDNQNTQNNSEPVIEDENVNTNKGVVESKQIDDLKVDNIQVKKQDGITYLYADVTNVGKDNQGDFRVHISMKDENDNEIIGFDQDLPVLSPGEKTNISIGSTDDFVNAYNCTITKVE